MRLAENLPSVWCAIQQKLLMENWMATFRTDIPVF